MTCGFAILHTIIQYTLIQYTLIQYTLIQYTLIQYTLIQYTLIQYTIIQYTLIQYTLIQYTLIQYTLIQYTLIQYTLIQYTLREEKDAHEMEIEKLSLDLTRAREECDNERKRSEEEVAQLNEQLQLLRQQSESKDSDLSLLAAENKTIKEELAEKTKLNGKVKKIHVQMYNYTVDREIFTVKIFASLVVGENLTHKNKTHHVLF